MTARCVLLFVLFSLMVVLLVTSSVWAQLPTATLNGIVTDPTDLALPGARVVLTSKATGETQETKTGPEGQYVFTNLAPGDYGLRIEAQGFAPSYEEIQLEVGHTITLDAKLKLAGVSEQVTVTGGLPALQRSTDLISAATLEGPVLNSHLVTVLPGFSFKILAEPKRPFEKLSTETLLAQFSKLRVAYREDERKAEDGSRAHSHYIETLMRLRGTVGELVRRHAFGFAEARDYIEFLYRNQLVGNEDVRLIGEISYDPVAVLRLQQDLQSSLKRLSDPSRVFVSYSGVALGFLEADPAKDTQQLAVPGVTALSRRFVPITKDIADPSVVYKIRLWIDCCDPPAGTSRGISTLDVQTIASNGQLKPADWNFQVKANRSFGQLVLQFRAQLEEYTAGNSVPIGQSIAVPIPRVTVVPSPTGPEKAWATFSRWLGSPATVLALLIALLVVIFGGPANLRQFFASQATKWGSVGRDKLQAIIRALKG